MSVGWSFEDLVRDNDGFTTRLIGTPEQIAEGMINWQGVNLFLLGYLHFPEEVAHFEEDRA